MNQYRYNKITVKVGSNVLTSPDGTLNEKNMQHLVDQIAQLHNNGVEVVLVSSGAVAAGRNIVDPQKKLDTVASRQLWSAVGQVKLINRYSEYFQKYNINCAQVLTTKENFSSRTHYLNMRNCFYTLNENSVIPIVNENDTISVTELMFTDNDELSGLIASMVNSEALIILSNIDGIFNGSPDLPESKIIEKILPDTKLNSEIISTRKSNFGRGGIITKYNIANKVAKEGISVHIANGIKENTLINLMNISSKTVNTHFVATEKKASDVKKWIAYSESFAKGEIIINQGAETALLSDNATSLLLIGVTKIIGSFKKGDIVRVKNEKGRLIAIGKSQYSSEKALKYLGNKNCQALVHYDYLYLAD